MKIHRATFRQPKRHLNELGVKVPAPVEVEIVPTPAGKRWRAQFAESQAPIRWSRTGQQIKCSTPGECKAAVGQLFEEQLGKWVEIDTYAVALRQPRPGKDVDDGSTMSNDPVK